MAETEGTQPTSATQTLVAFAIGAICAENYLIEGYAGAGGMGVVYRARDLKLERTVALKFIPSEVNASEQQKQRFLREARIASSLDHPNIGSIYGIDQTEDGRTFIVMAYYEGPSLADRIHPGGPIPVDEAIDIALQTARGLAEAHAHKIVHRDVKPSNLMFAGSGLIKIVDFGLAYVNQATATLTHGAAGTVGYMPPEQALNRGVDERADIWALGVVMAEMLTGRNPFQRDTMPATLLAVLSEPPAGLEAMPPELQQIVYKALSKDPEKRCQSCAELIAELEEARALLAPASSDSGSRGARRSRTTSGLRRSVQEASKSALNARADARRRRTLLRSGVVAVVLLLVGAVAWFTPARSWLLGGTGSGSVASSPIPQPAVLAVLPFSSSAGDARLNALGQGLVESVAAKLSSLAESRKFEVIPARNLQEKNLRTLADAQRQFGANLGLAVMLELTGGLVKVSYSLVNAQSGSSLGGNAITVPATDVFSVEDNVVQGTVQALQLKLRPEEQSALKVHGTTSAAAYDYYLQARGYLVDPTKMENVENAILMNREALKLDPNFGAAKAALGEAYWRKYSLTKDRRLTEQAKAECESAVSLGNAGAAGHICLGLLAVGTGQLREGANQYQLAIQLEPTNETAAIGLARALENEGAVDEAEAAYQKAIDAHPESYVAYSAMGGFYYNRSEYEKAIKMFQKVTELAPENYAGYVNLGGTYNDAGRFLEAIEPLKKSIALHPSYPGYSNLGTSYFGLHKLNDAATAYEQAVKLEPKQYIAWGNLGAAQYYSGAKQQGLASYRRAVELANEELKVNPQDPDVLSDLSQYYSMLGERELALTCLNQSLSYGHSKKELLASAAQVYNQLGETGLALEWMSKAIQAGYSASNFRDLPAFENLVDNPRYQDIVGKAQTAH